MSFPSLRSTSVVLVAAVALALLGAGCGHLTPGGRSDSSVAPSTVGPTATLQLGVLIDTGAADKGLDQAVLSGVRLAVSQFDGSDSALVVAADQVSLPSEPSAQAATRAAQRLVAEHVVAVVGPPDALALAGVRSTLARSSIPVFPISVPGSGSGPDSLPGSDSLSGPGISQADTVYATTADDSYMGLTAASELRHLGAGVLGVIHGSATQDARRTRSALLNGPGEGLQPGGNWSVGSGDLASLAQQVMASGSNGLYYSGTMAQGVELIQDLVADSYSGPVVVSTDSSPEQLFTALGSDSSGVYDLSASFDPSASPKPQSLVFSDSYRAAFGHLPPAWSAEAYDATEMIQSALRAGARNSVGVNSWIGSHSYQGITGNIAFDGANSLQPPFIYLTDTNDGQVVEVQAPSS